MKRVESWEVDTSRGEARPVRAGGCTVHTGRTLHYTGGNRSGLPKALEFIIGAQEHFFFLYEPVYYRTARPRRAFIVNCRPAEMVERERQNNYDHGKTGLDGIGTIHK